MINTKLKKSIINILILFFIITFLISTYKIIIYEIDKNNINKEIKDINKNVIWWIKVNNTNINYPFV